ncbi:hypothetical protein [Planomicrobium sp. CPCC 101110]|uniref:hypothetical protein n=1 Tax=Planomicrobium sp. CPCC 101110 TaxID=2599619 RepID=UPI0016446886|nr:hypothetical protein [Planomicrobium sp. CPCC 101110]
MAIITNEVKGMDKITVNYLEMYKDYIKGYKQYKKEKAAVMAAAEENSDAEMPAIQA